ncbi:LacI family DNA-binding transcriptional regulator [Herbaspirillum sp. RTI4]|uniref:LacI family DNA-binding transcriptional regulator n=1 Tax=Herbaspirillum sp. RTI4 TaxID=3048640 RepID=UPI002AB4BC9C|nr:LacI family DNA-binding transcriptional regulator [Herbaspirillum sp. RTI4]MDY7578980.1 LacI family DNA-binding transcriptional regulator [Herbaspirillum sp. RTI4]MEA9980911.1 LacI family DNA-binding transcriptional regulator [Herbaspirillum sp. RTI4]
MPIRKSAPTQSKRPTLADIAARVGVSSITVSRAISSPQLVSEELRSRIDIAIAELGYIPNRAARALARAHSDSVAVLIPSLSNTVFTDVLAGVHDVLHANGYRTLIGNTRYSPEEEENIFRAYLEHSPDGVLLASCDQTPMVQQLLQHTRIPVVHMMDLSDPQSCCVGLNQFDAGYAMARHLLQRGYRRIGALGAQLDPRVLQRLDGYRTALQEAGLAFPKGEILEAIPSSIGLGVGMLGRIVEQAPECDALFCCNDDLALGVLFEAQRRQIRVPEQLAVAGFNDLAASAWSSPSLTTIATPRYDIGHAAATMLLQKMRGETPPESHIDLGFSLMAREST